MVFNDKSHRLCACVLRSKCPAKRKERCTGFLQGFLQKRPKLAQVVLRASAIIHLPPPRSSVPCVLLLRTVTLSVLPAQSSAFVYQVTGFIKKRNIFMETYEIHPQFVASNSHEVTPVIIYIHSVWK